MNMDRLKKIIENNPRDLDDKCDLFKKCTAEEYEDLALFALETLCKGRKFTKRRDDADGWAAHHITKAFFEEQDIFDPYADAGFIQAAAKICPWYILRYTGDGT